MVFLAHFNSNLARAYWITVHLNGYIPKQTFQSQELHTKMISDNIRCILFCTMVKAQNHQQYFDIEVLCHI